MGTVLCCNTGWSKSVVNKLCHSSSCVLSCKGLLGMQWMAQHWNVMCTVQNNIIWPDLTHIDERDNYKKYLSYVRAICWLRMENTKILLGGRLTDADVYSLHISGNGPNRNTEKKPYHQPTPQHRLHIIIIIRMGHINIDTYGREKKTRCAMAAVGWRACCYDTLAGASRPTHIR